MNGQCSLMAHRKFSTGKIGVGRNADGAAKGYTSERLILFTNCVNLLQLEQLFGETNGYCHDQRHLT